MDQVPHKIGELQVYYEKKLKSVESENRKMRKRLVKVRNEKKSKKLDKKRMGDDA